MKSKKSIVISMAVKVCVIVGISFFFGLIFIEDWKPFAKGLALGGIFTILKIQLMYITFSKAVNKNGKSAQAYASFHYSLRYFLTLIVLVIGALEPSMNVFGVAIGILSMKVAAYWQGVMDKRTPKDGSVEFLEWEDDDEDEEGKDF